MVVEEGVAEQIDEGKCKLHKKNKKKNGKKEWKFTKLSKEMMAEIFLWLRSFWLYVKNMRIVSWKNEKRTAKIEVVLVEMKRQEYKETRYTKGLKLFKFP